MKRNLTILLFLFVFTSLIGCTFEKPTNYNNHITVKVIPRQNKETGKTPSIEETRDKAITIFEKRLNESVPKDIKEDRTILASTIKFFKNLFLNSKKQKKVLIQKEGEDQIKMSISEYIDINTVKELITNVGILQFKEQDEKNNKWKTVLTGDYLKPNSAKIAFDLNGNPYISLEFTSDGAKLFNEITKRNIKKPIGIYFDEKEISSPIVQSPILNGQCQISGYNMSIKKKKKIVILLNSDSLNADIQIIDSNRDNEKEKNIDVKNYEK